VTIGLREFELEKSYVEKTVSEPLNHAPTSHQTHSGKFLYIEIESCEKLPLGAQTFNQIPDAFVVVKLDGAEIARTKPIYNTQEPQWYDECYEVPAMVYKTDDGSNKKVQVEVWQMNTFSVGDLLGAAEFDTDVLTFNSKEIETLSKGLVVDKSLRKPRLTSDKKQKNNTDPENDTIDAELLQSGKVNEDGSAKLPDSAAGKQWNKVRKQIQNTQSHSDFRVPNPNPTRRVHRADKLKYKDVKNSNSTLLVALGIIVSYLFLGVVSFSFIFETSWSIRESLYVGRARECRPSERGPSNTRRGPLGPFEHPVGVTT